eukprot:CAMPEP_0170530926 /NCGR_PEP_ID=MMETSP0209-20121228/55809_1 /TAXON_ID=665100 ORGANISM="Litonotus pictus, Strain P1" /NCGR_SAMPLE_ID=MMETSP0209 /ASSEMBLY_ACC=CAM_ASM_000301 /LENGTH=158 /DNA_ID=CAMNT_0010824819 /DNA_START=313 /DNA_END=786 /DNA_ORIENTATION=+
MPNHYTDDRKGTSPKPEKDWKPQNKGIFSGNKQENHLKVQYKQTSDSLFKSPSKFSSSQVPWLTTYTTNSLASLNNTFNKKDSRGSGMVWDRKEEVYYEPKEERKEEEDGEIVHVIENNSGCSKRESSSDKEKDSETNKEKHFTLRKLVTFNSKCKDM